MLQGITSTIAGIAPPMFPLPQAPQRVRIYTEFNILLNC